RTSLRPPSDSVVGGAIQERSGSVAPSPIYSSGSASASSPAIRFVDLAFAYDGRPPALRGVSFNVGAGETVAVVGPTGSGKSTLGLLLARLWEPPPGTIFVGDRDVTRLPHGALRLILGYVPQDGFLFSRSIAENIALGRDGVDAVRTREAALAAGIADEVKAFAAGFDTVVGERGLTLSGGQRQRVALARAVIGRPPILVLDDPFASVDAAKEEEIVVNLRALAKGRTVLLMTHRLRAAQVADRVVVLDAGRVAEQGRHEELVRAGLLYGLRWLEAYLMNLTGQRVIHDLRAVLFGHLLRLEAAFFDRNPVGRLMTRVLGDVEAVSEAFTSGLFAVVADVITLAGVVTV